MNDYFYENIVFPRFGSSEMIIESKPCKFGLTDSQEEDEGTSVHMKYSAKARGNEGENDGIWYRAQDRENKVEKFHLVRRTGFAC